MKNKLMILAIAALTTGAALGSTEKSIGLLFKAVYGGLYIDQLEHNFAKEYADQIEQNYEEKKEELFNCWKNSENNIVDCVDNIILPEAAREKIVTERTNGQKQFEDHTKTYSNVENPFLVD